MKKIVKKAFLISLILMLVISLSGCGKEQNEDLNNKVEEEIHYIESILLSMLNGLNNISFENYKINIKEINEKESKKSATSEGDAEQVEDSESSSENGGSGKSSGGSSEGTSGESSEGSGQMAEMKPSSVLTNSTDDINWDKMKLNIEKLNEVWGNTISDMYRVGVKSEKVVSFSNDLNIAITSVSAENKQDALKNIAKLYTYLPQYMEALSGKSKEANLSNTKAHVINAYSKIEQENWQEIANDLKKAEESYNSIVNAAVESSEQSNVNKVYILLKEFQNAVSLKNKDILYIKYKNLMQDLVIL